MSTSLRQALVSGYERMSAWAPLLDRINVFPVADGDTGRNLALSLAPLRRPDLEREALLDALLMSARGNSGNIGVRFIQGLLEGAGELPLGQRLRRGRELAWASVAQPKPGTMLSLFDAAVEAVADDDPLDHPEQVEAVIDRLEAAVQQTPEQLPLLAEAGVVDSGALGMFLLLDGALQVRAGRPEAVRDLTARFPGLIHALPGGSAAGEEGFCVDAVLAVDSLAPGALECIAELGDSAVTLRHGPYVKVHLHTPDREGMRQKLEGLGRVVRWAWDDLTHQRRTFGRALPRQCLHVVTDAAGSVLREEADTLGFSVLHSYIALGDLSVPEHHLEPADLYRAMASGVPVSTSQASDFERHQHYQRLLGRHRRLLYLCVGSAFTGNHQTVSDWAGAHDPEGRMTIVDTGSASGMLGIVARATAREALAQEDPEVVLAFARDALRRAKEYIFLDRLHYLAAGGRLSKTGAFFGDLFRVKPVVSPGPDGARKVGAVRNARDQLPFALERIAEALHRPDAPGEAMLEFTDNEQRVREEVAPALAERFPGLRLSVQPISLTTGAHVGPGAWGVALLPDPPERP